MWNIATYSLMPGTKNVHDLNLAREFAFNQLKARGFVAKPSSSSEKSK